MLNLLLIILRSCRREGGIGIFPLLSLGARAEIPFRAPINSHGIEEVFLLLLREHFDSHPIKHFFSSPAFHLMLPAFHLLFPIFSLLRFSNTNTKTQHQQCRKKCTARVGERTFLREERDDNLFEECVPFSTWLK
jgi:hypothetical protein